MYIFLTEYDITPRQAEEDFTPEDLNVLWGFYKYKQFKIQMDNSKTENETENKPVAASAKYQPKGKKMGTFKIPEEYLPH